MDSILWVWSQNQAYLADLAPRGLLFPDSRRSSRPTHVDGRVARPALIVAGNACGVRAALHQPHDDVDEPPVRPRPGASDCRQFPDQAERSAPVADLA